MTVDDARNRPVAGQVRLRYWAAARSAAGLPEEDVPVTGATSLADLVTDAATRHGDRLAVVLEVCAVLVGDEPVGVRDRAKVRVTPGSTVEFLPPFAGG